MIESFLLIVYPVATWERIGQAQRGIWFVLFIFLLPLLTLVSGAEVYAMVQWGKAQGVFNLVSQVPPDQALSYGAARLVLGVLAVVIGAKLVKSIGETFHGRHTYVQAFRVAAYALGPLFLVRLLELWPPMNAWVCWAIGVVLSLAVLYHGLPRVMQPDPTHALGLYFVSSLFLIIVTVLTRLLEFLVLKYKLVFLAWPFGT